MHHFKRGPLRNLNKKKLIVLSIALSLAILLIAFFSSNSSLTANVIDDQTGLNNQNQSTLESALNQELTKVKSESDTSRNKITEKDEVINKLQLEISEKENKISELRGELDKLQNNQTDLARENKKLKENKDNFNSVIRSSVRDLCCSLSNIQSNNILDWGSPNGKIDCTETGYKINCGTGEIDNYEPLEENEE